MRNLLIVGIGGFFGAGCRYLIGGWVHRLAGVGFPWGTLTVNVLGCLAIGFLSGLVESRQLFSAEARLVIFIGFLGGFTTFSSFGYETMAFARDGELSLALLNVLAQIVLGLSGVYGGYLLSRIL